jgi:HypF Kae1-like domain
VIAHDRHPEYLSNKFALQQPGRKVAIQHHWAHIVACMAENEIVPPALGVSWASRRSSNRAPARSACSMKYSARSFGASRGI